MEVRDEGQPAQLRRSFLGAASRWLREPLLHFLLLGSVLFAAYGYFAPKPGGIETSQQIRLTTDDVLAMDAFFQSQWRRPPTPEEFGRMVENKVQEEVLYREAVAMGLDQEDSIVKRRMAQKMKFLAEDVAAAREPKRADLEAWYAQNAGQFALPGRINFRQIYFSPDRRAALAREDAVRALAQLSEQGVDSSLAASFSDPFMLQDYYADRTPEQLAREFGPLFAQAVFRSSPGSWQGPIESGFGWHLVFVDSLLPGRVPDFAEVESEVKTAWLGEQKAQAWRQAYDAMRAKYTVLLPLPPESAASTQPSQSPSPSPSPSPGSVSSLPPTKPQP
jgi:peptidyl-prolyl cis-trans isomerase C